MFYSAILLTGVNLLLRLVSTSFQVYISGRIGAAGVGLLQLVMSVGGMSMTAGMAGVRTATMYLTAEELGRKRPGNVHWVLRGSYVYSLVCSGTIGLLVYFAAPYLAVNWIGDARTIGALRLLAMRGHDRILHRRKPYWHVGSCRGGGTVMLNGCYRNGFDPVGRP